MPVPSTIDDLSTTAGSNSPPGSEAPGDGDNYLRSAFSFIALLRDKLNGTSDTGTVKNASVSAATFSGTHTFSSGNLLSGTYTPTGTAIGNISSVAPALFQYIRIGNVITVSGRVAVDPGAATTSSTFALTVPSGMTISSSALASGTASLSTATEDHVAQVYSDSFYSTSAVLISFMTTSDVNTRTWSVQYTFLAN